MNPDIVEKIMGDHKSKVVPKYEIILYNDSENTFAYVVSCLVKYCEHGASQAEQCALIAHHNGKCSVKVGDYIDLLPILSALTDRNLKAEIKEC